MGCRARQAAAARQGQGHPVWQRQGVHMDRRAAMATCFQYSVCSASVHCDARDVRPPHVSSTAATAVQIAPARSASHVRDANSTCRARRAPRHLHTATERIDAGLACSVSRWQRKHGCMPRPKLTTEQRTQLKECYALMVRTFAISAGRNMPRQSRSACQLLSSRQRRRLAH